MELAVKKRRLTKCVHEVKRLKRMDPFSRLPDEIIMDHILSRFTLEEAAKFTILSHKWKALWSRTIGSKLTFEPDHLRPVKITKKNRFRYSKNSLQSIDDRINRLRPSYELWVTKVVQAFAGPKLDDLTVRFPFNTKHRNSVDKWIECALKKGVTQLEFDFSSWGDASPLGFHFPKLEKLQAMLPSCGCGDLYNLKYLYLSHVNVTHDTLEFILARFPIEQLRMRFAVVGRLTVSGPSVRLKTLEFRQCRVALNISSSSLASLTYTGPQNNVVLEHVPHLSELTVDKRFCTTFVPNCFVTGGYIHGLKRLEFVMSAEALHGSINYPLELPETLNLEELKINLNGDVDACLLWPIVLIKASPFLRKFSVEFQLYKEEALHKPNDGQLIHLRNAAKRMRHHQYLTTVELHDYFGYESEVEFTRNLLGVSETLEQVIVSPASVDPKFSLAVKKKAEKIARWLPPISKAKFIILDPVSDPELY